MKIKSILLIGFFVFLIISCSSDLKDRTSQEILSSYLNNNSEAIIFGRIDAKSILEKADYKSIPKVNVLLIEEMRQYESALELAQGVHFALEGSIDQNSSTGIALAFVKVKNADTLANKVTSLGYMMKDEGGMKFFQENEVAIGVKDQVAIFLTKSGKFDGLAALKKAFKKCEDEASTGKIEEILNQKGDVLLGFNFENLYQSTSKMLEGLSKDKVKEIKALMADSYSYGTISFENGEAKIYGKNLFSNELMNRMIMKSDQSAPILKKLGFGKARFGFAFNMDMLKYDHFVNDFYPKLKSELTKINFQIQMALASLGENPFSALLNGQLGIVMIGDAISDGSFVPEFNFHVGLGNKGKIISEMLGAFTSTQTKNADGTFVMNNMAIKINEKEITAFVLKNKSLGSLVLPNFAKDFGKKGVSGFMDFDGLDLKSLDLEEGAKAIYALKNIYFEGDNLEYKMIITAKKSNQNILKQIADVYLEDIKNKIGMLN
jgi:hypothetical protein